MWIVFINSQIVTKIVSLSFLGLITKRIKFVLKKAFRCYHYINDKRRFLHWQIVLLKKRKVF